MQQDSNLSPGSYSNLNELKTQLIEEENGCSFECTSMSLGALIKGMNAMRLVDPPPTRPFEGYSVLMMEKAISDIKLPNYHQASSMRYGGGFGGSYDRPHNCSLAKKTAPIITKHLNNLQGLYLSTFTYKQ